MEQGILAVRNFGSARTIGTQHSVPWNFRTVQSHHSGDEARSALFEVFGDVAVGHDSAGGDRVDDVEHESCVNGKPLESTCRGRVRLESGVRGFRAFLSSQRRWTLGRTGRTWLADGSSWLLRTRALLLWCHGQESDWLVE